MTRSIIVGVDLDQDAVGVDAHGVGGQCLALVHDAVRERAHVGEAAVELQQTPVDAVEVEQVVQQAVGLAAAHLDHLEQALALLVGELELLAAPERGHRTEHGRRRPLQVVRDRVQERVLQLVQVAQLLGHVVLVHGDGALQLDRVLEGGEQGGQNQEHAQAHRAVPVRDQPAARIRVDVAEQTGRGGDHDHERSRPAAEVPGHEADRHEVEEPERDRVPRQVVEHPHDRDEQQAEHEDEGRWLLTEERLGAHQEMLSLLLLGPMHGLAHWSNLGSGGLPLEASATRFAVARSA